MSTDRDPLTPDELRSGGGWEPALDDIDCTPRPRFNESLRKFLERTQVVSIDGEIQVAPAPDPTKDDDLRWSRYVKRALQEQFPSSIPGEGPSVELRRGKVWILWPKHASDNVAAVLELARHATELAWQLQEAAAELRRRELGR